MRQKEAERRQQIENKENARMSYREKMKNATVIDVSFFVCKSLHSSLCIVIIKLCLKISETKKKMKKTLLISEMIKP